MFKALETAYAGCRFRSRLEARWALFFDAIREPWRYEVAGFQLSDGVWYLPDFWLPEMNLWLEVKGQPPTSAEVDKIRRLAQDSGNAAAIFHGIPTSNIGYLFAWKSRLFGQWECAVNDFCDEVCDEMALNVTATDGPFIYMDKRLSRPLRYGVHCCYASWCADIARLARFDGESFDELKKLANGEIGDRIHQTAVRIEEVA